jgi:hypothetical protein
VQDPPRDPRWEFRSTLLQGARFGLGFSLLSVVLTWPLASHLWDHVIDPRAFGPVGNWWRQDVFLNLWILAWGTHVLITDLGRMWQGNALYPMAQSLAGSEHMLGYQWLFAPLYLLTENPVFAAQSIVLLSFAFTGTSMALLGWRVTGRTLAGWVAGWLFAFSAWRFGELARVQLLGTFYLPLIVLCLFQFCHSGKRNALVGAGVLLVLQSLTSLYLGYFAFFTVGLLLLPAAFTRSCTVWQWLAIVVALCLAAAVLVPFSLPYSRLQAAGTIPSDAYANPMAVEFFLSARPWGRYFTAGSENYLGFGALFLTLFGCRRAGLEPWPGRIAWLTLAIGGFALSLGPALPMGQTLLPLPYQILGWFVPGLTALRYPLRFALLVSFAIALLAGRGVVVAMNWIERRDKGRVVCRWLGCALLGAVLLESRMVSDVSVRLEKVPAGSTVAPVYRWLRENGEGGVCVEVPVGEDDFPGWLRESRYMYFSTYHWLPIINGFTGHPAPESTAARRLARRLPDRAVAEKLRNSLGLRWIVLHRDELSPESLRRWQLDDSLGWHAAAEFGGDVVLDLAARRTAAP